MGCHRHRCQSHLRVWFCKKRIWFWERGRKGLFTGCDVAWSKFCGLTTIEATSTEDGVSLQFLVRKYHTVGTDFTVQLIETEIPRFQVTTLLIWASVEDAENFAGDVIRHIGNVLKGVIEWADNEAIVTEPLSL